jgi:hypothetical protein
MLLSSANAFAVDLARHHFAAWLGRGRRAAPAQGQLAVDNNQRGTAGAFIESTRCPSRIWPRANRADRFDWSSTGLVTAAHRRGLVAAFGIAS